MGKWFFKFLLFVFLLFDFLPVFSQNIMSDSLKSLILNKHNFYRKATGAKPLQWSEQLEKDAVLEANKLAINPYNYAPTLSYGENIFRSPNLPTPEEIINFWMREQRYYHGEEISEEGLMTYGHYTQIVWKQTSLLGCAMSVTKGGTYVIICLYSPKGNIAGQKP